MNSANDDAERDPVVEAALAEALPALMPILRAALARAAAPRRKAAPPRAALREEAGDRELADEVSRAKARELLARFDRRGRR